MCTPGVGFALASGVSQRRSVRVLWHERGARWLQPLLTTERERGSLATKIPAQQRRGAKNGGSMSFRFSVLRNAALLVVVFFASAKLAPGQVCLNCSSEEYFPGGLKEGNRGVCEAGFPSGFANCEAGETCTPAQKCEEVIVGYDDEGRPGKEQNCRSIAKCNGWCRREGSCGTGGGSPSAAPFVWVDDGSSWSFCAAEYAAWECGR